MPNPLDDEVVRLKLGGDEVPLAIDYSVDAGVMEVPAQFEMTLGHSGLVAELASRYPPYTPFELWVGDIKVQVGETDSYTPGEGSSISLSGRDMLKWLVDSQIRSERTFAEKTFFQLTQIALTEVGLDNVLIGTSNLVNRKAITGAAFIQEHGDTSEEGLAQVEKTAGKKKTYKTLKCEIGNTWFDFLSEQYRRAGLFLWSDVNGNLVLTRPTGTQSAVARLLRRRSSEVGEVTVLGSPSFTHDVQHRYSVCEVHGRGGGGKDGHGKVIASHYDEEMIALLNPNPADRANGGKREKPLIIRDEKVRTVEQAKFLARRKIAESRRHGWRLTYRVAGHTVEALKGGGRIVWQPDTVVEVIDDELGIEGPMYVESVRYTRNPQTVTELHLLRIEDLVFAEEDFEAQKKGQRPRLRERRGVTVFDRELDRRFIGSWRKNPVWGNVPIYRPPDKAPGPWIEKIPGQ